MMVQESRATTVASMADRKNKKLNQPTYSMILGSKSKLGRRSSMFVTAHRRSEINSLISLISRGSFSSEVGRKTQYQNTYKLYPDIKPEIPIIRDVVDNILKGKY